MNSRKKTITVVLVVAIIVATVILLVLLGKTNGYRIIKVHEFAGSAIVTRQGKGEMEPYNNMLLESGDNVYLDSGNMTLKMDEDKYAYVEEKTDFTIQAEGTREDSKTIIAVNQGSITNEIQNSLSSDASYEVNTPNSTMAVRGTVFRVSTYYDEAGVSYTKVSVFEGEVTSRLVYPDGTISEKEVSVPAGKELIIYEDNDTTDYLTEVTDIDYANLPDDVIDLLGRILEGGVDASSTTQTVDEEKNQKTENNTKVYMVTFCYNGAIFATQQVKEGECATVPLLIPATSGDWDFDFSTPITADISISWKE